MDAGNKNLQMVITQIIALFKMDGNVQQPSKALIRLQSANQSVVMASSKEQKSVMIMVIRMEMVATVYAKFN